MKKRALKKVAGGKLIRAEVEFDEAIRKLKITGDFFMHPEEAIDGLENSLIGIAVSISKEELESEIKQFIEARQILLIGFSPADLAEVIKAAMA